LRRFRSSAAPIAVLGVVGTFATAGLMAVFAHYLFGFDWITAGLLGAALAPTDPAVMFSVLGNREVGGRSGTILEGESGANDPVGIALMIGLIEFATHDGASYWGIVTELSIEMVVGLAFGLAGGAVLLPLLRVPMPSEGLYPIRALAAAGVIYGAATVAHGSGFLAVFVAGLLIGDVRAPYKAEIERFHTALASLAEIAVFAALGLTIDITNLGQGSLLVDGILLALLLALVARPLVVGPLLLPFRMRFGERLFIMWGGLKGAVPILLATFVLLAGVDDAERIYNIVFIVVAFSVIVQGASFPFVGGKLGVPMRDIEPEPWDLSIRLRQEPERQLERFVVGARSRARGKAIRDLPIGENSWISLVIQDGEPVQPRGSHVFQIGDEVLVLTEPEERSALRRLFAGERPVKAGDP
nr:potassium/proton antiporter [Actinomycetota bacterium]